MLLVFVYFHSLLIKFRLSFSLSPRSPGVAYPQPEPIQRPFWKVWPQSKTLSDLLFNHNIPFIPVPHTQDFLALFTLLYKTKTFCWDSCLSHSQSALRRESALLSDPFPYCTPPSALPGILSHKASSQWVWIFFFYLTEYLWKSRWSTYVYDLCLKFHFCVRRWKTVSVCMACGRGTAKWRAKTISAEEKQSAAYSSAETCIWQNKLKTGVTRPM